MDISFFIPKPPAERKAKPSRAGLNKRDRAAIRAYLAASATERKAISRDQVNAEKQAALIARRSWRRDYMQRWRSMRLMATILL